MNTRLLRHWLVAAARRTGAHTLAAICLYAHKAWALWHLRFGTRGAPFRGERSESTAGGSRYGCAMLRRGAWRGALAGVLALATLGSFASAQAVSKPPAPFAAVCRLPQTEIHFNQFSIGGGFDGSQMRIADTDVNYYPPTLRGLSLGGVSATLPIDFPVSDSKIRFFYVYDNRGVYNDTEPVRLLGCLYFNHRDKSYQLFHAYGVEGNSLPIVVSMFTLNLTRDMGPTLFVVVRWFIDIPAGSDTYYELHAYGTKELLKSGDKNYGNLDLGDFVAKVFGNNSWGVDDNETVQSVHAYVTKASIVNRLKQLGYLK